MTIIHSSRVIPHYILEAQPHAPLDDPDSPLFADITSRASTREERADLSSAMSRLGPKNTEEHNLAMGKLRNFGLCRKYSRNGFPITAADPFLIASISGSSVPFTFEYFLGRPAGTRLRDRTPFPATPSRSKLIRPEENLLIISPLASNYSCTVQRTYEKSPVLKLALSVDLSSGLSLRTRKPSGTMLILLDCPPFTSIPDYRNQRILTTASFNMGARTFLRLADILGKNPQDPCADQYRLLFEKHPRYLAWTLSYEKSTEEARSQDGQVLAIARDHELKLHLPTALIALMNDIPVPDVFDIDERFPLLIPPNEPDRVQGPLSIALGKTRPTLQDKKLLSTELGKIPFDEDTFVLEFQD